MTGHTRNPASESVGSLLVMNNEFLKLALSGGENHSDDDDTFSEIEDEIIFKGKSNRGKYENPKVLESCVHRRGRKRW